MKKILCAVIVGIVSLGSVHAQQAKLSHNIGDCDLVRNVRETAIPADWERLFGNMLPGDALKRAYDNLRSFCCDNAMIANATVCVSPQPLYLESPFLFDHLLDMYLRRLDAFTWENSDYDGVYGLSPDAQGQAWRNFITQTARKMEGTPPMVISSKYHEVWKPSLEYTHNFPRWTSENSYTARSLTNPEIIVANKDFANWKLVNKYSNACEIVAMAYVEVSGRSRTLLGGTWYSIYDKGYTRCKALVQKRIQQEYAYTKRIMAMQGNRFMMQYLNNYLQVAITQKNMQQFQSNIQDITTLMDSINNAIPKLVATCN